MATTAVEVSSLESTYSGTLPPVRARKAWTSRVRGFDFSSTVHPLYAPASVVLFPQEHSWSDAIPEANDRATRVLNVAVAILGLIIAAPLFFLIAAAIKIAGQGPVLYKQTRIGLDRRWNRAASHLDVRVKDLGGRPFTMYKFRTMVTCAEPDDKAVWATRSDKRVTRIGRFLRATRLDELPQLINVVKGDMNIVGPRPERPTIFAELREAIPNYHLRQRVMPGITGWAQVNQSYDTCVDDVRRKVALDLDYLRTRSVTQDLLIMARTVPIMLLCRLGW